MLRCVVDVTSGIMDSTGEVVVVVVLLVGRWDIELHSVPRVSRDLSSLLCHPQHRFSRIMDQAAMVRRVEVVLTTIMVMLLPMPPDRISIRRILISKVGILKILEVILRILLCQLVDPSGIREINPVREMLLLAAQDRLGRLASQVRDALPRDEVVRVTEVVVDDSKVRDMLITSHYRMLRTIQT
ncbi:hypothetical protein COP2_020740 [Malus domestica]